MPAKKLTTTDYAILAERVQTIQREEFKKRYTDTLEALEGPHYEAGAF